MPAQCRVEIDFAQNPEDGHGNVCCDHNVIGPGIEGSPDILVNKKKALRQGDPGIHTEEKCGHKDEFIVKGGSSTVYFNDRPAARLGDATMHCGGPGTLIMGSENVFVGGADISPND
jgi:uncharacterized Zn-binding protein involved in type VI secretion